MSERIIQVSVPVLLSDLQRLKQATQCEETKGAVMDAVEYRIQHPNKKLE